jgi:hypothetical protein
MKLRWTVSESFCLHCEIIPRSSRSRSNRDGSSLDRLQTKTDKDETILILIFFPFLKKMKQSKINLEKTYKICEQIKKHGITYDVLPKAIHKKDM